ncbi:3286_t:CDS:10 [Dentiscutata erythropus]|uniref:3286_t:CDS:1 n=1 Tax=Dentiscutata erythropus TaxID=1348616 RepID=A0A9N8WEH8_9GLOM|nr:3286_t:CDS:10 [Dentiscutata erythropus]
MFQVFKRFEHLLPQREFDTQLSARDDPQNISERIRSRVVIVTMLPHILLTKFLLLWRSSDIVSDRYMIYSTTVSAIFMVQIYNLCTSRVSSQFCAKLLSINFLISHILSLVDSQEKETLSYTISNSRFSFLFWVPPFSYVFANKKFGITTAIITCAIYLYEIFWPAAGVSLIRGAFYLVLDLIIPTLMFTLLSTFGVEKIFTDKQTEQAMEANRSRSVFLQTISHELRTPIHGILASTEILCSSNLSSAQRALISAIQNSGINVIHMADHILRVAKTEELNVLKGVTHECIPFDLYKATEQIADGMELLFENENIIFDFDYKIPLNQSMYLGDIGVIKQIIINLLGTVLSFDRLEKVTFSVNNHFKEETNTERTFTIELVIITTQKPQDLSELYDEDIGESSDKDSNPTVKMKPIPLRYISGKIEDADPRELLKIGVIRTNDSIATQKILNFLQGFEMQYDIINPDDISLCDINVLIFDSSEADNELIETICRNIRNTKILIISITYLLKHLIICETAQKVGLDDLDIYFVDKPFTIVKFWNSLMTAADTVNKRNNNIEDTTRSAQGEIGEPSSRQGEMNEESREEDSNPQQVASNRWRSSYDRLYQLHQIKGASATMDFYHQNRISSLNRAKPNKEISEEPSYQKIAPKLINGHLDELEDTDDIDGETWYPCNDEIPEDWLGPNNYEIVEFELKEKENKENNPGQELVNNNKTGEIEQDKSRAPIKYQHSKKQALKTNITKIETWNYHKDKTFNQKRKKNFPALTETTIWGLVIKNKKKKILDGERLKLTMISSERKERTYWNKNLTCRSQKKKKKSNTKFTMIKLIEK